MKNIWIELAQENKNKRIVNNWLCRIITVKARYQNQRLGMALYAMAEVVFNRFKVLLVKDDHYDEDDVMQECVLAQVKFLDGAEESEDPFGYLYMIVKARLQSLHDKKIEVSSKDYDFILSKFHEKIKTI
tara:strand:- start:3935 stop:4324 length:390 start_codon:yes stop_codon:yes gene_type:complete